MIMWGMLSGALLGYALMITLLLLFYYISHLSRTHEKVHYCLFVYQSPQLEGNISKLAEVLREEYANFREVILKTICQVYVHV